MAFSPLCEKIIPAYSGNYSNGRLRPLKAITIHHCGGVIDIESLGAIWQRAGRNGSSHYGVGYTGRIAGYVDEANTAWTNSNWDSNNESITIEVSNDSTGGDWHVSDASIESTVKLVADIAKRNNMGTLVKGQNVTWHSMFTATSCIPINSEVLTKKGWKKLQDVNIGEEIATPMLDNLNITFEEVLNVIPEKEQDTYTNNGLTATKDHNMIYSIQSSKNNYKINDYGSLLQEKKNVYIPLAGKNEFVGLDITEDMLKFYVAVQADGHYMYEKKANGDISYYGLEFHLKKQRKIDRLKEILENINLAYKENKKTDGSVSIRIYNEDDINIVKDVCEKLLKNKMFTWDWLQLNTSQANLFLDELLLWDGCVSGNKYTSKEKQNLDVVNAVASLNSKGSRIIGSDVIFRESPYITLSKENSKRNQQNKVSCVTVKTGLILIRQNGKTFVVGNCPGPYLMSKFDYIIAKANEINGSAPAPSPTPSAGNQILEVGSVVRFNGVFPINEVLGLSSKYPNGAVGSYATCYGAPCGSNDYIPCGPIATCNADGSNVNYNGVCRVGGHWTCNKEFVVKKVEFETKYTPNGVATLEADGVQFRVDCGPLYEVRDR